MTSSYAKKKTNEYYAKHSLEQRVVKVIANSKDKRYYLFRNVLSSRTTKECLDVLPHRRNLSSIQSGGRRFDATGDRKLQKIVRGADVFFKQRRAKSGPKQVGVVQQEMKVSAFYRTVASKLGIENAQLGPTDRLIVHDPSLQVCYLRFLNND